MPAGTGAGSSSGNNERTVFRPPWVKEKPAPIPVSAAPWTLKNRPTAKSENVDEESLVSKFPQLRKTSGPQPKPQNGRSSPPPIEQVQLRPTPKEIPIKLTREDSTAKEKPPFLSQKTLLRDPKERVIKPLRERPMTRTSTFDRDDIPSAHTLRKQDSILNIIPAAPPAPPAPPCPPPPPKFIPDGHKPLNTKQAKVIESLRQRPRARPDWGTLLKDVEAGKKLKHVVCNDRSKPLLPAIKSKTKEGQFVYESEKEKKDSDPHHILLKQIQTGVALKKVQTNDRSKPILDGLRKFRRQMTIEEQIQKSQSSAMLGALPPGEEEIEESSDEMDDIDKLRDDLQSTKQLLALELRNKEAQQKESKRLQARILNLEVELEHERGKAAASVTRSVMAERIEDDKLVTSLKQEAEDARKAAKDSEKKYIKCSDELDTVKGELDEAKRQNEILERKLEAALKALQGGGSRRQSQAPSGNEGEEEEAEDELTESDEEEEGEETEEKIEKRAKKEIKILTNKLKNVKDKKENARKERQSLKSQMKKEQEAIKQEKKKYKHLQREVDKMAKLMNDDEEDEENEDKDDEEKEYDDENEELSGEEEEETESESESSSESEEEDASESEAEDAPIEKRKENYTQRCRRHENQLAALKKGNYLLKANIDRLKDDINKQRDMSTQLQQDLDSILNDLG